MKNKIWLIVLAVVVTVLLLLFLSGGDKNFNKNVDMTTTNKVYNFGVDKSLDTILVQGLKAVDIQNISLGISYLPYPITVGDLELKAYTKEVTGGYLIVIKDTYKNETISIIAHEITHVKQLYDKRIKLTNNKFYWLGKEYSADSEYKDRPWEIEAFNKQDSIKDLIINKLY